MSHLSRNLAWLSDSSTVADVFSRALIIPASLISINCGLSVPKDNTKKIRRRNARQWSLKPKSNGA
jgi:hypothetical protein